ncbi:glycosyl hydrolase-related protein [Gloeomargaritales cyanobacterium VI4D9]|nr:glycosyl hydrolase-related protein [Gloeomargaritales cyanobacterium VI4D9]
MNGQEKIQALLTEISRLQYPERYELNTWQIAPEEEPDNLQDIKIPTAWGGYDQTIWWYKKVTLPPTWTNQKIALRMDIPEGLVFINNQAYHGIDTNHPEIILPAEIFPEFTIQIQAYSGRKQEPNLCQFSELVKVYPEAEKVYAWLEHLLAMSDDYAWVAKSLANLANHSSGKELNFSELNAQLFHNLRINLESEAAPQIHLIGHSHIDIIWLWTLKETRRKLARTFTTALHLIQEFPDFNFMQGQAQLYVYLQQDYPELYQRIESQVRLKKWHIEGAVWVEPDGNLINGESWVRQLIYGKRFFQQEFNTKCQILWLPDTFGYQGNLPQLLKLAGVNYFFTTKLNWNDTGEFPLDSFWWEGIDGTRVLAHQPPVGLEGLLSIKDLDKTGRQYQQRNITPVVLQTFGYGDGGGGVTRKHLQIYELTQPLNLPFPHRISHPTEFFQELEQYGEHLPIWQGELYLEKHRGTYTTHSRIKQLHRQAERELYLTELLATLGWLSGDPYPNELLEQTWKLLLLQQFHDILPGTFIPDAYPQILRDFEQIFQNLLSIRKRVWERLQIYPSQSNTWTVFNPIHTQENVYVILTLPQSDLASTVDQISFKTDGQIIPHQLLDESSPIPSLYPKAKEAKNILCCLSRLEAFSFAEIKLEVTNQLNVNQRELKIQPNELENNHLKLVLDSQGNLTELWDKRLGKNLLSPDQKGGELKIFLDRPKQWEAWDIDADYATYPSPDLELISAQIIEKGILRCGIEFNYTVQDEMGLSCQIRKSIYLYQDSPFVEFFIDVDLTNNQYAPLVMKILFPLALNCEQARFDIPFGLIQRLTSNPVQFEVPALTWADLSTDDWGVSLLSRDKYGFNVTPNTLGLTLMRVAHYPHPIEPWHLTDSKITDVGIHQFCFRLYPHPDSINTAQTVHKAQEFLYPPLVFPGSLQQSIPQIIRFNAPNLVVGCVKKAMDCDGIIIRIYEAYGQPVCAEIQPQFPVQAVWECDLLENRLNLLPNPELFTVNFTPFMLKTLLLIP